ncbi:Uncharacterised protein [BD1-7 clade bacterium]|uniref:General stress protein A n=1 Tax=BD1-7 clade bacterium TaxID=2029982 RepID=A0A5S9QWI2_9GAMM|nr:Uncharacterised protein [BD1-7 clade bacterium]
MQKNALVTVSTDCFLDGSLVMIDSFLHHNSWFSGDIIVLHDDSLSASSIATLTRMFTGLQCRRVDAELTLRIHNLVKYAPKLKSRQARFYSLNCFNICGYQQLIFVDSDTLFLDSIQPICQYSDKLIAAPDASHYRGKTRDRQSFAEKSNIDTENDGIATTFNAGLMIINERFRSDIIYRALLDKLSIDFWQHVRTDHTDQLILNIHFEDQIEIISSRYNYLLTHAALLKEQANIALDDVALLHFNGPLKPWHKKTSHLERMTPDFLDATRAWRLAYKKLDKI